MIAYKYGSFDILRADDLKELDKYIQISKEEGAEYFALGIYDDNMFEQLGFDKPLKSVEDRMKIMEQIRGIDFVFSINSLEPKIIEKRLKEKYKKFIKENKKSEVEKEYEIGYAPGTYDLFHAGHLENLQIASKQCKKLIVGVKSDELVFEHKNKRPVLPAEERMEILRHFKFVYGVYEYYTRNLHIANEYIENRFGKEVDAVFLGSDLRDDFADTEGINIVFTPRNPEMMKKRSTTAYRKLMLGHEKNRKYTSDKIIQKTKFGVEQKEDTCKEDNSKEH